MPILNPKGLGLSDAVDGYFQAEDAGRKRRQEDEAPAALSALLDAAAQRNAATPSPVFAPQGAMQPSAPAGAPSVAPKLPTFAQGNAIGQYAGAIQGNESGGNYQAVGPTHSKLGRALGAYQVMEANIGPWSREALGRSVSADEFLNNPKIQDAIFEHKFGQYVQKYGNPQDAASVWFTGRPLAQGANARDVLGTTGAKYVAMFNNGLKRQAGVTPDLPVTRMAMPGAEDAPLPPPRPAQIVLDDAPGSAQGQVASGDPAILPPSSPAMQRVQDEAKAKGIGQTSPEPTPAQALMTQAATRGATAPSAPPAPTFTGFAGVNGGGSLSMTPQLKAAAVAAYKNPNTRPVAAAIIGEILKGKQSEFSLENVNGHAVLFRKHDGAMFPLSGLEKAPEPYTLGENQSRFDGANRLVARGADKAEKDPEKSRILNDALANWQRYRLPDPNDPANAKYWQDYSAKVLGGGEVQKAPTSVEEHNHYVAEEKAAGRVPKSYEQWDLSRRRSQNQAEFGTIPAGHRLTRNEDGSVSMQPIPGSPAEREQNEAAQKAAQTKQQAAVSGGIVVQDIDRVLKLANDPDNLPISGGAGSLLSRIPYTAAHDAAALLETVKANATFDRLQQMRNSSPTGGALGSVSDYENRRLAATIGNLEQSQSKEQFVENLKRVKNTYLDIVHGEGKGPPREPSGPAAPQPATAPAKPTQGGATINGYTIKRIN